MDQNISFVNSFLLSFITGSVASIVTNPLDVVKVRMQVQRAELKWNDEISSGRYGYKNIFHGLGKMIKEEGFASLMRGVNSRVLYVGLQAAVYLSCLDSLRQKMLKTYENKK